MHDRPRCLVIGAMKAGSTSLANEIQSRFLAYLPPTKEPHFLMQEGLSTDQMRSLYRKLFSACPEGELPIDASTGYSKMPWGKRAIEALGALDQGDTKAIYILRGREQRAVSQYRHESISRGSVNTDHCRRFSLYAPVIRAWLKLLGPDRFRVVSLANLQSEADDTMGDLGRFLSAANRPSSPKSQRSAHMNRTSHMRSPRSNILATLLGKVGRSGTYKASVSRMIPRPVKSVLRHIITSKPKPIEFEVPHAWSSGFDHDRAEVIKIQEMHPEVFIRDSASVR